MDSSGERGEKLITKQTSAMLHVIKMDIQVLAEQCFNECAVKKVLVEPGEFKEAGKLIMLARK